MQLASVDGMGEVGTHGEEGGVKVEADTPAQQHLLDLIAAELGGTDWFEVEGFNAYEWGETPAEPAPRPVLFLDGGYAIGTLPDGALAGTKKKGPQVNMMSFKDGRIRAHAPVMLGDPDRN